MLKKQYRLPAHIRLHTPTTARLPVFFLKVGRNNLSYNRFGFVISKAVDKRASTRNRAKRKLRSCVEEMVGELKTGYDMLFFLEKGIIQKQREVLCQELRDVMKQKNVI